MASSHPHHDPHSSSEEADVPKAVVAATDETPQAFWSAPASQEQATANMLLCREILECQGTLQLTRKRLSALKLQHKQQVQLQALQVNARQAWPALGKKQKWKKETLAAALKSPELPVVLHEDSWEQLVPKHIRHDGDLFLLRLGRSEFCHYYRCQANVLVFPETLRDDIKILTKLVEVYPEILELDVLTQEQLDNELVFEALLKSKGGLHRHHVQQFSNRLRANKQLMLRILQRNAYCLATIASCLKNDKDFALEFASTGQKPTDHDLDAGLHSSFPDCALKTFSHRLRADKDVVLAFCARAGGNLKYTTSYPIRRDRAVVEAACQSDPLALTYCLQSRTKQKLTSSKAFMLELFERIASAGNPSEPEYSRTVAAQYSLFKMTSARLKEDPDVFAAAMAADCVGSTSVDYSLWNNADIWRNILTRAPHLYACDAFPPVLYDDVSLARTAVTNLKHSEQTEVVDLVADRFPTLDSLDHASLLNLARLVPFECWDVCWPWAERMWVDREIVLAACTLDGDALECVDEPLIEDVEIVAAALKQMPDALCFVPIHVQHSNPHLVALAIQHTSPDDLWELYESIDVDMWTFRQVALAWVGNGGDFIHDDFAPDLEDDQELFLLMAENNWENFGCASDELQANKEFMLQALEKEGRLLRECSEELTGDFDLALVAFAGSEHVVGQYLTGRDGDFAFLVRFAKQVRERLQAHDAFIQVLGGMWKNSMPLAILNQGQETTLAYKKLIAGFVGLSTFKELQRLRQASAQLTRWGF